MRKFLQGKKTYLTAVASVVGALAAYASGEASLIDAAQVAVTGLVGAFVRKGIARTAF